MNFSKVGNMYLLHIHVPASPALLCQFNNQINSSKYSSIFSTKPRVHVLRGAEASCFETFPTCPGLGRQLGLAFLPNFTINYNVALNKLASFSASLHSAIYLEDAYQPSLYSNSYAL